jgi:hypothetical protein
MFAAAKDAVAAQAARAFINDRIARYGTLQELKIDSRNKTMRAVCLLQGEREPVTVLIDNYKITGAGENCAVEVLACSCSRAWLQNLLSDFVIGRRVPVPSWAAAAL